MANINQMIADLDQQISSLQTARQALAEAHGVGAALHTVGPRKFALTKVAGAGTRRTMSPDARRRIADAQKKRWALVNKAKGGASKKVAAKKVVAKKVAAPAKKTGGYRPKTKNVPVPAAVAQTPAQETAPEEGVS